MNTTKEERALIDRFKIAFNRLHEYMQKEFHAEREHFGILLDRMLSMQLLRKRDYQFLHNCRNLRNNVVHDPNLYMAVPSIYVVERIERLTNYFYDEPTVVTVFGKPVQTIEANQTMYRVMKIIEETGFTQFPVYDGDNFVNLLTENVLTLWLAKHVVRIQEMGFADLRDTAADALKLHDDDQHWEFIPRHMSVAEATTLFAERPVLEALIITERAQLHEAPLGIVTRSDALDMLDGKIDRKS